MQTGILNGILFGLAEETTKQNAGGLSATVVIGILISIAILAYFASNLVTKSFRMPEHGWRAFVTVFLAGCGILIVATSTPKMGIDLEGGVILVYEIDEQKTKEINELSDGMTQSPQEIMRGLVKAISERINPGGVQETVVRPYGDKQLEIIIPDVGPEEVEVIKKKIHTGGFLKFMIVANERNHSHVWQLADDPKQAGNNLVKNDAGKTLGQWVDIATKQEPNGETVYQVDDRGAKTRVRNGVKQTLMYVDSQNPLEGKHLTNVRPDYDDLSRVVAFNLNPLGAKFMGAITATNRPDETTGFKSRLGITLDDRLISAPNINDTITSSGIIQGIPDAEVDLLVDILRAGRLPAILRKDPISQNIVNPLLGKDTIRRGKAAIGWSLVGVLVFMFLYYFAFSGAVACVALLLNLILIFALMIFVGAAFSLAGLAGLVLTVGMSVDANVLIFERMGEEIRNGAALRMAIRNGFSRAIPTIVDANVTNLITAIVLYGMGGEQLQSYAVPLILGILMCLFTAIFVSRMVFEIAERRKWITKLPSRRLLNSQNWNMFRMRNAAAVFSVSLIVVGLIAALSRGSRLFDIDFNGGNTVTFKLDEPMPIADVRKTLDGIANEYMVTGIQQDDVNDQIFQVDTSVLTDASGKPIQGEETSEQLNLVKQKLVERFTESGRLKLTTHHVNFTQPKTFTGSIDTESSGMSLPSDSTLTVPNKIDESDFTPPSKPDANDGSAIDADADQMFASANPVGFLLGQVDQTPAVDSASEDLTNGLVEIPNANADGKLKQSKSTLTFADPISGATVKEELRIAADKLNLGGPSIDVKNPDWDGQSSKGYNTWDVILSVEPNQMTQVLDSMKTNIESTPVWLLANEVGSKVAGHTQSSAIAAIFLSLLGIVAYIWIRFQRVEYGIAAVIALIHDVLVMIGAIGLSYWVVTSIPPLANLLLINEFKISLPVVAAILTIIGYSLNDTIVVFDRIREVKGKSPEVTEKIINTSINQTLSRTLLTSLTTLIVVVILYIFGGQGIHPFSFALLVGVIVGTYSSIFVASTCLLWMTKSKESPSAAPPTKTEKIRV